QCYSCRAPEPPCHRKENLGSKNIIREVSVTDLLRVLMITHAVTFTEIIESISASSHYVISKDNFAVSVLGLDRPNSQPWIHPLNFSHANAVHLELLVIVRAQPTKQLVFGCFQPV